MIAAMLLTVTRPTQIMAPPHGYSHLIFEDGFVGPTLDSTKWIPQIADQNGIWQNYGALPNPLSAVGNAGKFKAEYGNPLEIAVRHGLTLTAHRDTSQKGYQWRAGYICTHGKFTFDHGYAQFRAKMPDSRTGGWGAIWFLEGGGEIDLDESGFSQIGKDKVNRIMAVDLQTPGNNQQLIDTGFDLSAGYHIYGMEYLPARSITMYLDHKQVAQFTNNIPTGAYTIVITNTIAQNTGNWHTLPTPASPAQTTMNLSEVQVWQ